jgi:hypothetical protein
MDHPEGGYDVFLAHAADAKDFMRRLQTRLEAAGFHVFSDERELEPGSVYDAEIEDAIKSCRVFVFVTSADSVASGAYALTELEWALKARRRLLGVHAEGHDQVRPPPEVDATTYVRTRGDRTAQTVSEVRSIMRAQRAQESWWSRLPPWARSALIALLASAVIAGLGVAYLVTRPGPGQGQTMPESSLPRAAESAISTTPAASERGPLSSIATASAEGSGPTASVAATSAKPAPEASGSRPGGVLDDRISPKNTSDKLIKSIEIAQPWTKFKQPTCTPRPPNETVTLLHPGVVALKQEGTRVGYGFVTPKGYLIGPADLMNDPKTDSIYVPGLGKPYSFAVGERSRLVTLACPTTGGGLRVKQLARRGTKELMLGQIIKIHRGLDSTTEGKLIEKSAVYPLWPPKDKEVFDRFLNVDGVALGSDAGAPALDDSGRIVGALYFNLRRSPRGGQSRSLVVPIDEIISAFPYAFE